MRTCNNCILNENYYDISFDKEGKCSLCTGNNTFKPAGEEKLLKIFENAKKKKYDYDALVPLSGGKDSIYILQLAVNIYKLKILTMTYDNGFLSQIALDNINNAVEKTKVKHVFYKQDTGVQKKIYKNMFIASGDICGACDIATKAYILKTARDYKTPLILYGISPLEEDSFLPDSIQDIKRFKFILKQTNNLTKKQINDFLIYPKLNHFLMSFYKKTGVFAKEVSPLFYIENPDDKKMGEIIAKELDWKEDKSREYSKHFDCIAEPLTNYVRNKIYGYERRICQYSNMIRRNEITRDKALEMYAKDDIESKPKNYREILTYLDMSEKDLEEIIKLKPLKYEKHTSKLNKLFTKLMTIKQRLNMFYY